MQIACVYVNNFADVRFTSSKLLFICHRDPDYKRHSDCTPVSVTLPPPTIRSSLSPPPLPPLLVH